LNHQPGRFFRQRLLARIVALVSAPALCAPAACSGGYGGGAPNGAGPAAVGGGVGGSTTTGTSGSSGVPECFAWSTDMGDCPTAPEIVLQQLKCCGCPTGWEPKSIDSGPMSGTPNQCCYMVQLELCAQGGRPFLVDEEARVAPSARGVAANGWASGERPDLASLSATDRDALASAWTADALLEHASVASFARLSLALLAAGAPPELIDETHRAAADEVRHARLCFALASAYAGEDVGPGAFPLGGAVQVPATLGELAVSTVREGCVGETVAAVVAAEQLARATDPAVRAALTEIAADEARHAELAWKTVAWAVNAGGGEVRRLTARALFDALAGASRVCGAREASPPACVPREAHGRLDAATTEAAAARAMTEVVAPAAWALFGGTTLYELDSCAVEWDRDDDA
jgi:hypothetical protein